ncbi:MAG: GNAT family N-acetyltransferase [Bacteroidales bacterium]
MITISKSGLSFEIETFDPHTGINELSTYLNQLSPLSRSRFGPHGYEVASLEQFFFRPDAPSAFVARESTHHQIIAYALLKRGFLDHDAPRLQSYGLQLDAETDATLAPSVADAWQSKGIGSVLLEYIIHEARSKGIRRIILWGGVQSGNTQAMRLYQKFGFRTLGSFEYYGENLDMVLEIEQE